MRLISSKSSVLPNWELVVVAASMASAFHCTMAPAQQREVPPPKWPTAVDQLFFPDVREVLQGDRPDYDSLASPRPVPTNASSPVASTVAGLGSAAQPTQWSRWIPADILESEIKRRVTTLQRLGGSGARFKAGEYKQCRREFAMLAVLMAINARHDERPRWQDVAPQFATAMATVADLCEAPSDAAFQMTTQRKYDLTDLVRGGRPDLPDASQSRTPELLAGELSFRPEIMQRMEKALRETLKSKTANKREFISNTTDIAHEARVLAMLAEVIHQPGFDDADDSTYAQYARDLRQGATDLADAADEKDFSAASRAMVITTRSCSDCHADYRG